MSTLTFNYGYWEFWASYAPENEYFGPQKVTFDGERKLILINPGVTEIIVNQDLYSAWKEWLQVRDNSKFLPAFRSSGGDVIAANLALSDIYFLTNGWKIYLDRAVTFKGSVFADNGESPYTVAGNTILVTSQVSQIINTVLPEVTPESLWNYIISGATQPGSAAERLKQTLTTGNFIALK